MQWTPSSPLATSLPQVVPVNFVDHSIRSIAAEFEKQSELMARCSAVGSSVHSGGLLCGFDGSSSVFSHVEFPSTDNDSDDGDASVPTESSSGMSAESVLANCARQKKLIVEDVRSLQRAFWCASHSAWEAASATEQSRAKTRDHARQRDSLHDTSPTQASSTITTRPQRIAGRRRPQPEHARPQENSDESSDAARRALILKPRQNNPPAAVRARRSKQPAFR